VPIVKDLASGTYPVFSAAKAVTIKSAHAIPVSTLAAGTANYFSLALAEPRHRGRWHRLRSPRLWAAPSPGARRRPGPL
jgi:hypothetical protein